MSTPRKPKSPAQAAAAGAPAAGNVWLAGLDALAQAQARGSEAFDALMRESLAQQAKAREAAEAELSKAAEHFQALTAGAATAPWDRLGGIFETRVSRALQRLGMPTPEALGALTARIDALQARVAQLEQQLQQQQPSAAQAPPSTAAPRRAPASAKRGRSRTDQD